MVLLSLALALPTKSALPPLALVSKWQVAFQRGNDVWIASGDGANPHMILPNADDPSWSRDGMKLAFRRGKHIYIYDVKTKRVKSVGLIPAPWIDAAGQELSIEWDPVLPMLLYAAPEGTEMHVAMLAGEVDQFYGYTTFTGMRDQGSKNYWPRWSPSGRYLGFIHNGDIWIAERDPNSLRRSQPFDGRFYYWRGRRLLPLAAYYDADMGAGATTPCWVDEIEWTRDEKRMAFHFQRMGGAGVSEIGYVDLLPPVHRWEDFSGFHTKTTWLGAGFSPRICPDGRTLSYIAGSALTLVTWDGKTKRKLFDDLEDPAWRPEQKSR